MSDYTADELLDLLNRRASEKEAPSSSYPLEDFIREFDIKKGVDRIPTFVIHYTYAESFGGKLSKIEFFRQFNKRFKDCKARTGKQRVYKLDGSSFDLSREGLIRAEYFAKEGK